MLVFGVFQVISFMRNITVKFLPRTCPNTIKKCLTVTNGSKHPMNGPKGKSN